MDIRPVTVADGVLVVTGTHVNWVLVREGDEVTLVDSGYPRDEARLDAALAAAGGTLAAVVLTHAHPDHLGSAERLRTRHGVPVLVHDREVAHARGEVIEQASTASVLVRAWRPRVLRWALDISRAGVRDAERVAEPRGFAADGALDVPGRPVPVPTPGHTSGHCAFHLPGRGVLIVGDALATAHEVTRRTGPQMLPGFFQHDAASAVRSLEALRGLPADVVVPGHGPPWRGSPEEAVRQALRGLP